MQTIKLRVNEKIYQQLMWFLNRFNQEELQIIEENEGFLSVQDDLKKELEKVESNKAEYISLEQLDHDLETTIRQYEA